MGSADVLERPHKKRRMFVETSDDEELQEPTFAPEPSLPDELNSLSETGIDAESKLSSFSHARRDNSGDDSFDPDLFSSFIGEQLPDATVRILQKICGKDIERGQIACLRNKAFD